MFSWITGPRITNVIEDLQAEPAYESTFVDPPETPAHQFAVKAFKHALFGTPAPEDLNNATRKFEAKAKAASVNAKFTELPAPKDNDLLQSPAKRAGGILMTPGTASKGRKTVSFGSQIEDNEGKTNAISRSGVPNNCPGKFPSPWTPGTELKLEAGSDKRPRTKLTEALLDARTTTQPKSGQKPKARDDSDITLDLGAPRSDSGKYWKEQYESYAERSEKEMKKIVAKQQLAKKFAMKKDGEVTELATKLEQERKRFRSRERELEQQNKDFQERLRQAMAESTSTSIENAALKARIATLESTAAMATGSAPEKPEFSIYEDTSKEAIRLRKETTSAVEAPFLPSLSTASSGKENNSPPKSRRARRQTVPDSVTRSNEPSRMGTAKDEFSIILAKSPAATELTKPTLDPPQSVRPSRTPLSSRRVNPVKENAGAGSPVPVLPSSPLPMPSPDLPDPWMNMDESSIPQLDKRAMPTAGSPYVNPAWNPPARQHRTSKSVSQNNKVEPQPEKRDVRQKENADAKLLAEQPKSDLEARLAALSSKPTKKDDTKRSNTEPAKHSPTDPRFDLAKITSHHAEGSIKVKHDRAEMLPVDRKTEARRRLEERKRLKKAAPA